MVDKRELRKPLICLPLAGLLLLPVACLADGDAPKGVPVKVGDSGMTMTFGGFAKVDFIQDFDPVGNQDQFKVNSIPVEGTDGAELGGSNNISARQTRFTLDVRGAESADQFRAYVEGDFFGSGNSFRMRHGYGEWKGFLGGQTWSTFQDITARPSTLDYEGPDAEIFVRQPMLRYTGKLSETVNFSIALEDQNTQLTLADSTTSTGRGQIPDIPARIRFEPDWGHVQVAGMARELRYVSGDGKIKESTMGFGGNLSAKVKIASDDALMGHVAVGSGIGRYVESFGGMGADAIMLADGSLETIDILATVLGYSHAWSPRLRSTLSGGIANIDNPDGQAGSAIKSTRSAHANLVFSATPQVVLGGELMWGERENKDGATGSATRFQFSTQYKFH